ncbi:MAG: hypothetical protein ACFCBW_09205 [Candidatus Competibacterales bacterium]
MKLNLTVRLGRRLALALGMGLLGVPWSTLANLSPVDTWEITFTKFDQERLIPLDERSNKACVSAIKPHDAGHMEQLQLMCSELGVQIYLLLRDWNAALRKFDKEVIGHLNERFAGEACVSALKPYYAAYMEQLQHMRSGLDVRIYLLLREAMIISAIELSPYQGVIPCEIIPWWPMTRRHVVQKLDLMANLFALIGNESPPREDWNRSVGQLKGQVLEPLSQHFANQPCKSDLQPYFDAYIEHLQGLRSQLDRRTFFLFREALIITALELNPYQGILQCDIVDWWPLVRGHVEQKINLMANLFVIIQD